MAVNAAKKRQCRIQVKSRYYSSDRAFLIKNFDCDYVVYAALNRARSRRDKGDGWPKPPSLYVLPIDLVKAVRRMSHPWGPAVYLNDVEDAGKRYLEKWAPIRKHLGLGRR